MKYQYLAVADADRIHEYVFSPHELKFIRGGSAVQARLNRELLPSELTQYTDAVPIYAGGGTVLAKFEERAKAESFCIAAQRLFRQRTEIATITTAVGRYREGHFGDSRDDLMNLLERRKGNRSIHAFGGGNPYFVSCEACGMYPAASLLSLEDRRKLVCNACSIRHENSRRSAYYPLELTPARDFGEIGEFSSPQNYLALCYIDVDRLGRHLHDNAKDEDDFAELSETINLAVQEGVKESCQELLSSGGNAHYEILLLGGDDALIVIPTQYIFPFFATFEKRYKKRFGKNANIPSFSAGVVISHSQHPISELLRHAEDLLKSAKSIEIGPERPPSEYTPKRPSIDYAILSTGVSGGIIHERNEVARRGAHRPRTMKPYLLDELLKFVSSVKFLKDIGIPASKIKPLYRIAYQGLEQANLEYLYLLSRLESTHRTCLRRVIEGEEMKAQFWRSPRGGVEDISTNAADLVELWDFL